jgi:peptide/nickel transport system permease protein
MTKVKLFQYTLYYLHVLTLDNLHLFRHPFFMFKNKLALVGALIILVLIVAAIFAAFIAPYDPLEQNIIERLSPPSKDHWFGQDEVGRDILSRIIYGSRISLRVGIFTVSISLLVGLVIGSISGYYGGLVDEVFMRVVDILMAFPGILLAIAMVAVLGPNLNNVILALCLIGWVGYARLVRGQVLYLRELEYVAAARALGASPARIISLHIVPNLIAPVIVESTFGMAGAILAESSLSFLGLGAQPPTPSWGSMLNVGREFLLIAPHTTTFPGLAIMLVVLGFNFLGDGLRDYLDVKRT